MICPPEHKHGATSTCYGTHKCRCDECRAGNAAERRRSRKRVAYGRPTAINLVDAAPARVHVNMLRAAGLGADRISELSGVPRNVIRHLLYGTYKTPPAVRMRAVNAAALLAVPPDPASRVLLDPTGTKRRLQALAVRGWSFAVLANKLGVTTGAIHGYLNVQGVTRGTRDRVAALFDELWDQVPPQATKGDRVSYGHTVSFASRQGWVGPLGWDDIDDDPEPPAAPTPADPRGVHERENMVRELHARRWSDRRIGRHLGMPARSVLRIRGRLGLPGLTQDQWESAA